MGSIFVIYAQVFFRVILLISDSFEPLQVDPITISRGGNYSKDTSRVSSHHGTPVPSSPASVRPRDLSSLNPPAQDSSPSKVGPELLKKAVEKQTQLSENVMIQKRQNVRDLVTFEN